MDDSLDFFKDHPTPRRLLRRFIEVANVQETPATLRTQEDAAKSESAQNTESGTKRRRSTRRSTGDQSMYSEVLRQEAKQSSSFVDQSFNMSVIQGANQTYANVEVPDIDSSSSLIASPDMEKAAKWQKNKKKRLEGASVPAEVVSKPHKKKKSLKKVLPSTETSTASISKKDQSEGKSSDTTDIMAQETQSIEPHTEVMQSSKANASENQSHISLPKVALPKAAADEAVSNVSINVSSVADDTYSSISADDSHLNIEKAKVRFGSQVSSRKLILPSIMEFLPTKQKSTDAETVANAGDGLVAPELQAPMTSFEAPEEPSNRTSQDKSNDFILPPESFRDDGTFTGETLREANLSNDQGKSISFTVIHQDEPDVSRGRFPFTPVPPQEDDALVPLVSTSVDQRKNVGELSTTATPTRSAQRKSVAELNTTTTPTRSAQRKSVAELSTTTTPTRSAQRKSVAELSTTATPTRSAQRKSVAELSTTTTPTRSAQRKNVAELSTTTTPTRSAQRKKVADLSTAATPTRSAQRKSVAELSTTTTPTRSAQRKSVAELSTTTTPTRSAQRKSVAELSTTATSIRSAQKRSVAELSTTATSIRSAQKRSVAELSTTATSTRSAQNKSVGEITAMISTTTSRKSVGSNVASILVSPEKDEAIQDRLTTESLDEGRESQASGTEKQVTTATVSVPAPDDGTDGTTSISQRKEDSRDAQDDEFEDENPNKKKRISNYESEDVAQDALPEDAIEAAPLTDSEDEFEFIPEPIKLSFHANDSHVTTASPVDAQKGETSLPKTKATTPKVRSSAPFSTAQVRQMTMKEFLHQLKTKPVPPPVTQPKPMLAGLVGTGSATKSPAKAPQKLQRKSKNKRELPATLPRSVTKELFTHFAKCRVTARAVNEVVKISEIFWENFSKDLSVVSSSRKSEQIEAKDVEKVMSRVGVTNSEQSLNALVEELLPIEVWNQFMPFPEPGKNPFKPFTGVLFNPDQAAGDEDEEHVGE